MYIIYILIRIGTNVVVGWVTAVLRMWEVSRFESGLGDLTEVIYLLVMFDLS
jgi:hypothetical protein